MTTDANPKAEPFSNAEKDPDDWTTGDEPMTGAQDDEDVLERHDQHQRPEDQTDDTEDVELVDGERMVPDEHLLHRVERAGADVAIDDADGAERELGEAVAGVPVVAVMGRDAGSRPHRRIVGVHAEALRESMTQVAIVRMVRGA